MSDNHRQCMMKQLQRDNMLMLSPHVPRLTGKQTQRNNVPATSPEEYYRRPVTLPFIDHLLVELKTR